jgi:hypothetical protein
MTTARLGLGATAIGVLLFFIGLYGIVGPSWSLVASAIGVVTIVAGLITLLIVALRLPRSRPHPLVIGIGLLGIAMYAYVHPFAGGAIGWWFWASTPYVLCIIVSCFASLRSASVSGAIIALVCDAFTHYTVATSKSSTAALAYIFAPLWSAFVLAPIAVFVTWLVLWRKRSRHADAP